MSSAIAGSVAAVAIASPTLHSQNHFGDVSTSNEQTRYLTTPINNHVTVYRSTMQPTDHEEKSVLSSTSDRKIAINVRGSIFETFESTLARYPETLLGCEHKRKRYYDQERRQYCFDRNREAFNAILYYYQSSGKLIRPGDVLEETFLDDLEFFEIDPWNVAELEYGPENFTKPKRKNGKKAKVDGENERDGLLESAWDVPEESRKTIHTPCNVLLSWPCVVFVIVYVFSTCLSSLRGYQSSLSTACRNGSTPKETETYENPLVVLHFACSVWFLFEFLLRLTLSVTRLRYILSVLGVIDILCVLSTFLQIPLPQTDICDPGVLTWFANFLRASSFVCLFKLSRYSTGLRLFGQTFKACSEQLMLSLYCVGICLLFYSAVVYFMEFSENPAFGSIVDAFWFTLVTLTTVGYGDIVPITIAGRLLGAFCSVFGVTIIMAWPATIFVSHFTEIYYHEIGRKKRKKRSIWARGFYKFRKGLVRLDERGCSFK